MRYDIILSPNAIEDLHRLKASIRAMVRDAIEIHLRYEPTKTSKSRIKQLEGISSPKYRLRVDEMRIFYDVHPGMVIIHAIVQKSESEAWLKTFGDSR